MSYVLCFRWSVLGVGYKMLAVLVLGVGYAVCDVRCYVPGVRYPALVAMC